MVRIPVCELKLAEGDEGGMIEPSWGLIERFIKAKSENDFLSLAVTCGDLFDTSTATISAENGVLDSRDIGFRDPDMGIENYAQASFLLSKAVELKAFIQSDDHSKESFASLLSNGEIFSDHTSEHFASKTGDFVCIEPNKASLKNEDARKNASRLVKSRAYEAYAEDPFASMQAKRFAGGKYDCDYMVGFEISGKQYIRFVRQALRTLRVGSSIEYAGKEARGYLIFFYPYCTDDADGRAEVAAFILDALMSVHYCNIRLVFRNGLEVKYCGCLLSSLWHCLSESLRAGRSLRCESCGIPIISFGERGRKRRYCSDACRKRAERARKTP